MENNNSCCCCLGTDSQKEQLSQLLKSALSEKWTIIKILEEIQSIYGYLPRGVLEEVSNKISMPLSKIYSVATFYSQFSLTPKGDYPISVCLGTACYVNGADAIFSKVCQMLNIKEGECSKDGKFSIDQTRCVGCCGMAPVMTVGKDVYGNVKLADVESILKKYMEN